ncbi:restriction endonuclease subunit S [Aliarcobacter cryaerophilus]|uniref:restriction endonuclease subunit S n=1 Tax=Aliarcobacter cryaerophilus TaxID=28198 RepID=UPI003DA4F8C4
MKYKKYPSYKDSGVEWLGDIPENWNLLKNRHIFKTKDKVLNDKEDMTVLSLTTNGVKVKNNLSFGKSTESYVGHQMVYPGNLVFTPRDFDQTPILSGVSKYKGCISNLYLVLETNSKAYNHFVDYYWWGLKYKVNYFKNFSYGIRFSYNFEQFKEIPFLQPPIQEQQQIADFLDKATAKIDTLIKKQTKQIELLKEKRQAVISHAVTKGINPNVPMKDSGVEWLGEIPEHWGTSPLKFLISEPLMYGANESADRDNPNDPRYIRITDIKKDGTLHEHTFKSLPIEIAKPYLLKENSLLLTRTGATVGKSFLYEISWGVACFAGYLIKAVISPNKALSKYVYYFTNTPNYWQWLKSSQIQATIENVSAEKYSSLSLPVPSLAEQRQIVEYIDDKTSKIDILIEKSNKSIELLKEKRTALISAAVTGKIDVREFE